MTDEQNDLLNRFQVSMQELMRRCDRLKAENSELKSRLTEREQTLLELRAKYENLRMARALVQADDTEAERTKARLAKLVSDVDKCIAMLKSS